MHARAIRRSTPTRGGRRVGAAAHHRGAATTASGGSRDRLPGPSFRRQVRRMLRLRAPAAGAPFVTPHEPSSSSREPALGPGDCRGILRWPRSSSSSSTRPSPISSSTAGTDCSVDRGEWRVRASEWRAEEEDVRELAIALIALGGRHLDDASAVRRRAARGRHPCARRPAAGCAGGNGGVDPGAAARRADDSTALRGRRDVRRGDAHAARGHDRPPREPSRDGRGRRRARRRSSPRSWVEPTRRSGSSPSKTSPSSASTTRTMCGWRRVSPISRAPAESASPASSARPSA